MLLVKDTNWTWYRYDAGTNAQMTLTNLPLTNQKLVITPLNTNLEIDLITITPTAGISTLHLRLLVAQQQSLQ
ncbi:MAG: hypothetical protein IPM91_18920 [Bacteroidetes bacterium]|nr:hypothetical protein [Bacteroidota bacterium]